MKNLMIFISLLIFGTNFAQADVLFKTKRIEKEYSKLPNKNAWLADIIDFADVHQGIIYSKDIVITEIYRTQEEQDRYYRGKKKFRSPHQDWLAVDLRTRHYTQKQIDTLVIGINRYYNKINTYIPTAFYHDIGLGKHIHIQFKERK